MGAEWPAGAALAMESWPERSRGLMSGILQGLRNLGFLFAVVAGADRITVTLSDGTTVLAKVVGTDPESDLAVAQVDLPADRLRPVQLADSTQVKVGQLAAAFGNPFGLQSTMTVGFVSALGRVLPAGPDEEQGPSYTIADILQTDAPLNPGNSGGVLVDDAGRVIGATSAIVSPAGVSAGIGFAIPSAVVQKVVPALIQTGHYEHPFAAGLPRPARSVDAIAQRPPSASGSDAQPSPCEQTLSDWLRLLRPRSTGSCGVV